MRRDASSDYDRGNRRAAKLILQAPERYPGGLLEWARSWMQRHGGQQEWQEAGDRKQLELGFTSGQEALNNAITGI